MRTELIAAIGTSVIVAFGYATYRMETMGIENAKRAKIEALEYAKQGWVYKCGWSCEWERIPGGPTAGDSARRGE